MCSYNFVYVVDVVVASSSMVRSLHQQQIDIFLFRFSFIYFFWFCYSINHTYFGLKRMNDLGMYNEFNILIWRNAKKKKENVPLVIPIIQVHNTLKNCIIQEKNYRFGKINTYWNFMSNLEKIRVFFCLQHQSSNNHQS